MLQTQSISSFENNNDDFFINKTIYFALIVV